jgi:hypothetical protein
MKTFKKLLCAVFVTAMATACDNKAEHEAEIEAARQAAIDSVNAITARERMIDSMNRAGIEQPSVTVLPPAEETKPTTRRADPPKTRKEKETGTVKTPEKTPTTSPTPDPAPTTPSTVASGEQGNTGTAGTNTGTAGDGTEEKKKKGVSNTVKGAVIGAGAGAVGGAIINKKNPGKGAIIGGVVGAGAGAVTGIILDKNKKKREARDTAGAKTATTESGSTTK